MHICYLIKIHEFDTSILGLRISNRILCAIFAIAQLAVAVASFGQHLYSWYEYGTVFHCRSLLPANASMGQRFLANDIVIFDFGLMNRILGTTECVANYLDGGYMRCSWCAEQAGALLLLLTCVACVPRPVWLLWPALFMQSAYVLGMAILTMAVAPKMMDALTGDVDGPLGVALTIYLSGVSLNWFFTLVLWHYYWGMEVKQERMAENAELE